MRGVYLLSGVNPGAGDIVPSAIAFPREMKRFN